MDISIKVMFQQEANALSSTDALSEDISADSDIEDNSSEAHNEDMTPVKETHEPDIQVSVVTPGRVHYHLVSVC